MFATGHKEMKQHLATLTLQIDRLDYLPDDWTSSQAEEVTLRLEAMLTQERCVVSRMEEMLDAAARSPVGEAVLVALKDQVDEAEGEDRDQRSCDAAHQDRPHHLHCGAELCAGEGADLRRLQPR